MPDADLLVVHAASLWGAWPGDGPVRADGSAAPTPIEDGAVAIRAGRVVAVGTTQELGSFEARRVVDATGRTVVPGLVDAHAHPVFIGHRAWELDAKLAGATYDDLLARGGGLHATVRATRNAGLAELEAESRPRLEAALATGTTTMESKSGYALDVPGERRILEATRALSTGPVRLVPTLLAGHAVPPERTDRAAYIAEAAALGPEMKKAGLARFVDAFIDRGALTIDEGKRLLEEGMQAGLGARVHADELTRTGATALAVQLEAASADHCNRITEADVTALVGSETTAVLCPATPFASAGTIPYAPARRLWDGGARVALGSDLNPNAWNESMVFTMRLAVHAMGLRPVEALAAATVNAADSLGLPDAGRLSVGAAGDLLVLEGPTIDWVAYRFGVDPVVAVVRAGEVKRGPEGGVR